LLVACGELRSIEGGDAAIIESVEKKCRMVDGGWVELVDFAKGAIYRHWSRGGKHIVHEIMKSSAVFIMGLLNETRPRWRYSANIFDG